MNIQLSWLKQYVDISCGVEEFAARMVMAGFEVESIDDLAKGLNHVVAGRVTAMERNPNSDHLWVCQLDAGEEAPVQIVTGAQNVSVGAWVPVALVGADLPCGLSIKKSKLRGVESLGMLCSGAELCIGDDTYPGASVDGIMILRETPGMAPGLPMAEILGMDETLVDFKITANRPDCQSVVGMAREAAAVLNTTFRLPATGFAEGAGQFVGMAKVGVEEAALCPRYMARMVDNVVVRPSPPWMQRALRLNGIRAINNIVDITNYVMLEMGQPLHAFDFSFIEGQEITVRRARAGESIMTLDGGERALDPNMLVISDSQKAVAVAGVMGGEFSGVYDHTSRVMFESANFDFSSVRLTSRSLGLRTESSSRYEKGLDPALAEFALNRAMSLVCELGAGEVASGCADVCNADIVPRKLAVPVAAVNARLGQSLSGEAMAGVLNRLAIETQTDGETLCCVVPTFRRDIQGMADIAEEVQRIHGYLTIPSTALEGASVAGGYTTKIQTVGQKLADALCGMGFYEASTYSFMSPAAFDKLGVAEDHPMRQAIRLLNPLGEEYSLMRTTMAPGMLGSLLNNYAHRQETAWLFELGRVYLPQTLPLTELPLEKNMLCLGALGGNMDFFALKGTVEALFELMKLPEAEFSTQWPENGMGESAAFAEDYYHPGRRAVARVGGETIGQLGELHPDAAGRFELPRGVYMAELDVDAICRLAREKTPLKPLPRFPETTRDMAVRVGVAQPVGPMLKSIRKNGGQWLQSAELFDIYEGAQVGPGMKSVAFALSFRADDRTLTVEEVAEAFDRVVGALGKEFGAELR